MPELQVTPIVPSSITSNPSIYQPPDLSKSTLLGRLAIASGSLGFGALVLTASAWAVQSRMLYFTVDNAVVNAKTVELRSPQEGSIVEFNVKPGSEVVAGQIMAKIKPPIEAEAATLKLKADLDLLNAQKSQVEQTLVLLNTQLNGIAQQELQLTSQQSYLDSHGRSVNNAKVQAATVDLSQYQAAIDAATTKATAAKIDYDRYVSLAAEGAISQQKVSQIKAVWDGTEADVVKANAAKVSAQASIRALEQEAPIDSLAATSSLQGQRINVMQSIQEQKVKFSTLSTEIIGKEAQLKVQQTKTKNQLEETQIKTPINGRVYQTTSDKGEQVSRSSPLMSVVDCESRWVEVFIRASEVNRIDRSQPVHITPVGSSKQLSGTIESINGINPDELKQQSQAVFPIVPSNSNGQVPARVVIKFKNIEELPNVQNMCGVGQSLKVTFSTQSSFF
jgi:multidrug resistance efflux pump